MWGAAERRVGSRAAAAGCREACAAAVTAPAPAPAPAAGLLAKPPKRAALKTAHKESMELTRAINADNEEHFAATAASQPGGKLSVVSAGAGGRAGRVACAGLAAGGAPVLGGMGRGHAGRQAAGALRRRGTRRRHPLPLGAALTSAAAATALVQLKAPVATTADQKQRAKKSLKPGNVFGMARQGN